MLTAISWLRLHAGAAPGLRMSLLLCASAAGGCPAPEFCHPAGQSSYLSSRLQLHARTLTGCCHANLCMYSIAGHCGLQWPASGSTGRPVMRAWCMPLASLLLACSTCDDPSHPARLSRVRSAWAMQSASTMPALRSSLNKAACGSPCPIDCAPGPLQWKRRLGWWTGGAR